MTVHYDCPKCGSTCFVTGAEPEDLIEAMVDFGCEECGCDFEAGINGVSVNE